MTRYITKDDYFLDKWGRDYYKKKLSEKYPLQAEEIQTMHDTELMNVWDAEEEDQPKVIKVIIEEW